MVPSSFRHFAYIHVQFIKVMQKSKFLFRVILMPFAAVSCERMVTGESCYALVNYVTL